MNDGISQVLIAFYRPLIQRAVLLASSKTQMSPYFRQVNRDEGQLFWSRGIKRTSEKFRYRDSALLDELYDRLRLFEGSELEQIIKTVEDPLLIPAAQWILTHEGTSKEHFKTQFKTKSYSRKTPASFYFPAIVLLQLVADDRRLMENLTRRSCTDPASLYAPLNKKKLSTKLASAYLTFFDADLAQRVTSISEHVTRLSTYKETGTKIGKYTIPNGFRLVTTSVENWEASIDELYNNDPTQTALYTALGNCLDTITRTISGRLRFNKAFQGLTTTNAEYALLRSILFNFTSNQILWSYKQSQGESYKESKLSKKLGVSVTHAEDELVVKDSYQTRRCTTSSDYADTIQHLPVVAYFLNKFYQAAIKRAS